MSALTTEKQLFKTTQRTLWRGGERKADNYISFTAVPDREIQHCDIIILHMKQTGTCRQVTSFNVCWSDPPCGLCVQITYCASNNYWRAWYFFEINDWVERVIGLSTAAIPRNALHQHHNYYYNILIISICSLVTHCYQPLLLFHFMNHSSHITIPVCKVVSFATKRERFPIPCLYFNRDLSMQHKLKWR